MSKLGWAARGAVIAIAAASLGLGAAGCGSDEESVEVADAWARTSAMSQTAGAAYMIITGGSSDDRLVSVSVSSDIAVDAQIHETVMAEGSDMTETTEMDMGSEDTGSKEMGSEDMDDDSMTGQMTMQEVDAIDIPAGETVALEPGGYHVMLMDLASPLEEGSTFDLTLEFETAGEQVVEVTVKQA